MKRLPLSPLADPVRVLARGRTSGSSILSQKPQTVVAKTVSEHVDELIFFGAADAEDGIERSGTTKIRHDVHDVQRIRESTERDRYRFKMRPEQLEPGLQCVAEQQY